MEKNFGMNGIRHLSLSTSLLLSALLAQGAAGQYAIEKRIPAPGTGGWDYVQIDSAARRLYISHSTQVEVLNPDSGEVIGTIPDTPGVHGIAIASEFKHGFTSNGREDKVSMFDPATLKLIKKIDVGKGPDGIYYDPGSKRVFTCNHGSDDITAIDASTGAVAGSVKVGGGGEQMVTGKDGLLYVNIEDTAEVVVIDPKGLTVKNRFPIGVAKTPTGLAYDAKTNRLFIMCRNEPKMVVMDAANGKVVTSLPIGGGTDYAAFDPDSKMIFASCGDGTLNIFHEKSANEIEDAGAVKTQQSAKTMAFDPKTKKIYLPAAEYQTAAAAEPGKKAARTMKPGSFTVLVVSQ